MIELEHVHKEFNGRTVLTGVSLKIERNEMISFIGPSGAGKSTLLNIMGMLDTPDKGIVHIFNYSNPKKKATYLRRYVLGYVFQNFFLTNNETVKTNLLLSVKYNKSFSLPQLGHVLERVGLDPAILNQKVYQLSGGEQQRVAIARVMLKPCEIIFADEPTGNLDEENKRQIISLLCELKQMGKTIICVTHDQEIANRSDRVMSIEHGRVRNA